MSTQREVRKTKQWDITKQLSVIYRSAHRPIEVSSDKLLDARFVCGVQVLELVHGRKLLHIQPVGCHNIWEMKHSCFSNHHQSLLQ